MRQLRSTEDYLQAISEATRAILRCGARGLFEGLRVGVITGGICGLPYFLIGALPGAVIGAGVGLVHGFLSGLLYGMLLGRWGGLIAGALPGVTISILLALATNRDSGCLFPLPIAIIGGVVGWRVGRSLEPRGPHNPALSELYCLLRHSYEHHTIPFWLRVLVGVTILACLGELGAGVVRLLI
jgi:hypothetical protein